jgi:hypothetical protein
VRGIAHDEDGHTRTRNEKRRVFYENKFARLKKIDFAVDFPRFACKGGQIASWN